MSVARVQARGQVTIPQDIRRACDIASGTDLLFVQTGPNTFECRRLPGKRSLVETIERLAVPGEAPDLEGLRRDMGDGIAQEVLGDRQEAEVPPVR